MTETKDTGLKELARRAQQGDGEAFVRLIEAHKQSLYKIARSYCRNEMDAEDAVAQTVLDCWERIDTLRKPAAFKTWLTRVLINNCNDILRHQARLVVTDMPPEPEPPGDEYGDLYFQALMDCLTATVRPVMELYYGEGFKVREIAELMGVPVGTVTARLKRGRQQLAAAMEKGEA